MFRKFVAVTLTLLVSLPAMSMNVLTSIKPIQLIANELVIESNSLDLLLASNTSPHDYALKPSDVRKVRSADLVIWYGHDLEPFLESVVAENEQVLTITDIPNLELREFEDSHGHDHHGHYHGSHDPHFWLGTAPSRSVARAITERLIELDGGNEQQYKANLAKFETNLEQTVSDIKAQLEPVQAEGYYVFHDAYGYFEEQFGLNHLGYFTVSPERRPGAKTLVQIRSALSEGKAKCVFSEPQFTPAIVTSVTRGSDVLVGELDPIGSTTAVEQGGYFNFLKTVSNSFYSCLSQ
ncbi:zinc ABC transporter substrate-binding protein ZnuA [Vibrio mexicanus]|uniref:zinc ABC transporter substrate-binding protein ZnuA n=1 Tax=Vibrio mexicanus TaxID=1004326 RepID=UPI00063CA1C1|nr:zinc ABC transporter substrate-binding protein ZnuA [Vibrio mexicanus]